MEHWKNKSIEDIPGEEWKPIVGYPRYYTVSNFGRIKSVFYGYEKMIAQGLVHGYLYANIMPIEGKQKAVRVHRLVAKSFLQDDSLRKEVNHINGIKIDNRAENLEWCTRSENTLHSYHILGQESPAKGKFGKDSGSSKPVLQTDLRDNVINEFDSVVDVQHKLGYHNTCISRALHGRRKTAFGYKWKFKTETEVTHQES
jgi:hypothetical protein